VEGSKGKDNEILSVFARCPGFGDDESEERNIVTSHNERIKIQESHEFYLRISKD
jgi:hypothetical protein